VPLKKTRPTTKRIKKVGTVRLPPDTGVTMRKVIVIFAVVIVVIVVGLGIFVATFDVNRYHDRIQAELQTQLNRTVQLGEMHLGLFPPKFRVQDLAISDDPKFAAQSPFVKAQELDVSVKLLPLLQKSIEIDSVTLLQPNVQLIKNRQGIWNFASLGSGSPATSSSSGKSRFSLGELLIQNGRVELTDLQMGSPRAIYDHIDVTLRDFAPDQPFSIDVAAHLPGAGEQEIQLQGKGGPLAADQPAATPFQGTLNFKQVTIAGFRQFVSSPALENTDGVLSGETRINSSAGKLSASGQTTAENMKVHGTTLGYPISAEYDLSDDLAAGLITIRSTTVKLGETPFVINGTVNTEPTPARLDLNLKANGISIAEAVKLAAASGIAFAPGITVNGKVDADIHARGAADQPALTGTISAHDVEASGKEVPQPVSVKSVNLTLSPAEIHSDNFNVVSGGTAVAVKFALRQYTAKSPLVDASIKAPKAALPELLSMAKAYGVTGLDKVSGAGTLSLDLHAAGPVQSLASNAVAKALNGNLVLDFNTVRYTGADIGHELASIGGFLKTSDSGQGVTNISKITGNIVIKNGIAQTSNLQALLDIGTVAAAGTSNLADQTLNLRATAVLSKAFSQQVGGASIGGFLQTALANNQGELVIPAIITGTFDKPRFAPDLHQVAQMKLKGLLPNSSNPAAAVSGLLGGLLGQKNAGQGQQQSGQQQQPQQNPVQDLINIFGKKKK
jgi:AsmA protein